MLKTVGNPSTRYGDQTIIDGNLVIGTAGKGIDFSATPGTGTSELLDDYEEGTFTATLTAATTPPNTPPTVTGYYTKIGEVVNVRFWFNSVDTTGGVGFMIVTGLPFTCRNNGNNGRVIGDVLSFGLSVPDKYNVSVFGLKYHNVVFYVHSRQCRIYRCFDDIWRWQVSCRQHHIHHRILRSTSWHWKKKPISLSSAFSLTAALVFARQPTLFAAALLSRKATGAASCSHQKL
jgi:hypothetical protein